jgi:cobyrinic acid a,c-diamide synthase
VHGYANFDPELRLAGVIANHCGSEGHARWLRETLEALPGPRLLGSVLRGSMPELSSRHLGLVSAVPGTVPAEVLDQLADALAPGLLMDGIIQAARSAPAMPHMKSREAESIRKCRLGIARDEAFHFYYPDNLQALERAGCELIDFSPLHDRRLPDGLNGVYLGGGYPEEHASALSANTGMLQQIRAFPGLIYAECGGLMYLAEGIELRDGSRFSMAGLLPAWVRIGERLKALRYVEVSLLEPGFWGEQGATLRGHEYHYSELLNQPGWKTVYQVTQRRSGKILREGFQHGSVLASYVHLHFASCPRAVHSFCESVAGRGSRVAGRRSQHLSLTRDP